MQKGNKNLFKSKIEKNQKAFKTVMKAPGRPIQIDNVEMAVICRKVTPLEPLNADFDGQNQKFGTKNVVSTPFAVLQGKSNWNYLNYEDDLFESTFHCSDFKATPAISETQKKVEKSAEKQPKEETTGPGYFLRSTVAAAGSYNVRDTAEISFVVDDIDLA